IRQRWSPFGIGREGIQVVRVVVTQVFLSIWILYVTLGLHPSVTSLQWNRGRGLRCQRFSSCACGERGGASYSATITTLPWRKVIAAFPFASPAESRPEVGEPPTVAWPSSWDTLKWRPTRPKSPRQTTVPVPSSAAVGTGSEPTPIRRTGPSTSPFSSIPVTPAGARKLALNVPRPRPVSATRAWSAPAPAGNERPSTAKGGSSKLDPSSRRPSARDVNVPPSRKSWRNATHACDESSSMPRLGLSAFPPARKSSAGTLASGATLLSRAATARRRKTCVRPSAPLSVQENIAVPSPDAATVAPEALCAGSTSSGASGADQLPSAAMYALRASPPAVVNATYALPPIVIETAGCWT